MQGAHDYRRVDPKEPRKENIAASTDLIVGTARTAVANQVHHSLCPRSPKQPSVQRRSQVSSLHLQHRHASPSADQEHAGPQSHARKSL